MSRKRENGNRFHYYINNSKVVPKDADAVTIYPPVTEIKAKDFFGCSSLTFIHIAESVTSIGREAFAKCSSLTLIQIPESVTSIGEEAFYNCDSLELRQVNGLNYNACIETWLQQRFTNLPIHQACYHAGPATTTAFLIHLIEENLSTLKCTDAMGMTALHILCSNPVDNKDMIKTLLMMFGLQDSKEPYRDDHCLICMMATRTTTFVHGDTGHIVCCLTCAEELKARGQKVSSRLVIWYSNYVCIFTQQY